MTAFENELRSEERAHLNQHHCPFRTFVISTLKTLEKQVAVLSSECDNAEMRSRRSMLLLHGVPEQKDEDCSEVFLEVASQHLAAPNLSAGDLIRSIRLGRLHSEAVRDGLWMAKKKLKGTGITMSEFLTKPRHKLFVAARERLVPGASSLISGRCRETVSAGPESRDFPAPAPAPAPVAAVSLPKSKRAQSLLDVAFSDVHRNFNVVHINAQSIPAHFPDMLASFDNKNIHAILVSETFLNPCLSSSSYNLPGFQLIRNDRVSSSHRGVAIFLRSHISFTILSRSSQPPPSNSAEHLFLEISLSHCKVLLGVFYSPSLRVDYFESFEQLLENFAPSYAHTIIMGDFNTCLMKNDFRSKRLLSVIDSSNLHILPLKETHHFPNCTPSLLDLIIVSSPTLAAKHGHYSADAFSYHDLVYLSYRIRPPKLKPTVQLQRSFARIDQEQLLADAANIDWSAIFATESVDEQIELFNTLLVELYDVHAPVSPVKMKHLPAPWLTDEIRKVKKNSAKAKFKVDPSNLNELKYNRIRNRCNTMIRDAQRRHIHNSVENEDPVKVWKFLKYLGVGKSCSINPVNNLDINQLNSYFSSSLPLDGRRKAETLQRLSNLPTPDSSFFLHQFTDCDVKRTIK
ncbi:hypothetical protein evm_014115 [Chilo suppressalis]|nr:hypothetical protein evm_014115 [Chilo suppressalis]